NQSRIADSRNRAGQLSGDGRRDSLYYQMMRARVQLFYEESPGLAAQRFRALLDQHEGEHSAARYGLALALIRSGQQAEAETELQTLLAEHPDNIAVQLAQVELDGCLNRRDQSISRLEQLLAMQPDNYPVLEAKTTMLLRKQDCRGAERVTVRLARLRSDAPSVWYLVLEGRALAGII